MKLKEIKPGMVIHCNSQEEYERLNEETQRLGLKGLPTSFSQDIVYVINEYVVLWNYAKNCNYTEFSDLIIPEMSAEEVLQICSEICRSGSCDICPMGEEYCFSETESDKKKIIEICQQWKSDNEKKEPEIETVDICRIIEILPDGRKRCVHEEDIKSELPFGGDERQRVEEILKKYCMEHDGNFIAVHEVVSRVKAVE